MKVQYQFFKTTTGIKSRSDVFDESTFMTFLTKLGVTPTFQIPSRRETGKEIPESSRVEFLEKVSANNFALSDAEDSTSEPSK